MSHRLHHFVGAAALIAAAAAADTAPASAQPVDVELHDARLFGIDHANGNLYQYAFANAHRKTVGSIAQAGDTPMTGIEAAGYFPGFSGMLAMWADPDDGQNKLVHVNIADARATVLVSGLEGGKFTGAATVNNDTVKYTLFAVQQEVVQPPAEIAGLININPNNSDDNEFYVDTPQGRISRDGLHNAGSLPASGTIYEGPASTVFVKPKGNGKQSGVTMNGEPVSFKNSNTYRFAGDMDIRIYNDRPRNGKAMGHWWIEIVSGTAILNDEIEVLYPNRLTVVDHRTGDVTEVMRLGRAYQSLATRDGVVFYTQAEGQVYRIDTAAGTETAVADSGLARAGDLEFIGTRLMGYDRDGARLSDISVPGFEPENPRSGYVGLGETDPIVFAPVVPMTDETMIAALYD